MTHNFFFTFEDDDFEDLFKSCNFEKLINNQKEYMLWFFDVNFEIWNMNSNFPDAKNEYFKKLDKIKGEFPNITYPFDKFNVERTNNSKEPIKWIEEIDKDYVLMFQESFIIFGFKRVCEENGDLIKEKKKELNNEQKEFVLRTLVERQDLHCIYDSQTEDYIFVKFWHSEPDEGFKDHFEEIQGQSVVIGLKNDILLITKYSFIRILFNHNENKTTNIKQSQYIKDYNENHNSFNSNHSFPNSSLENQRNFKNMEMPEFMNFNFLSGMDSEENEIHKKKLEKNIENLEKLYETHENMFVAYRKLISRTKEAKFHLDRAWNILGKISKILIKGGNVSQEKKWELKKKIICCFVYFGCWFENIGNLKLSKQYLNQATTRLEEFNFEIENINNQIGGQKIREKKAEIMGALGVLYEKMGKPQKAEEFYLKWLTIRQSLFHENNSVVALSLKNMGDIYGNLVNFPKAEEFYLKSLKINQNFFSENHSNVCGLLLRNLGTIYQNMGNVTKAEEFSFVVNIGENLNLILSVKAIESDGSLTFDLINPDEDSNQNNVYLIRFVYKENRWFKVVFFYNFSITYILSCVMIVNMGMR